MPLGGLIPYRQPRRNPGLAAFLAQTSAHDGGAPMTAPPTAMSGPADDPLAAPPPVSGPIKAQSAPAPRTPQHNTMYQQALLADVQRRAQAQRALGPGLSYFLR